MSGIYMIKDLGRYTLFSTVVIQPTLLGRPDRLDHDEVSTAYRFGYINNARGVAAFGHSIGQRLPGTRRVATRLDTNMRVAAQVVDEGIEALGLGWRIPVQTPGEFRLDQQDHPYVVSQDDVREFVGAAKIAFYCGGEKPFYELPLASRPIVFDADDTQHPVEDETIRQDAIGSWGSYLTVIAPRLLVARLEKFYGEVQFPDRLPHLQGPLTFIYVIETQRSRGVN